MPANWKSRCTVLSRLGRHHFAFFRGYLDGIDLRKLSARYIETNSMLADTTDLRAANSLLAWIIEELTLIARRSGNTAGIRLIRMAPEKLATGMPLHVPDLEEFSGERDPYGMFSEHELLQLFEEEYAHLLIPGSNRRLNRNKRLRERQIAVLTCLESLVDADPRLEDRIDGWFDPAIARRLVNAGITTLNELVTTIEIYGFRWYTRVPRIGVRAAGHIRDWLLLPETAQSLGVTLSVRSVQARKRIDLSTLPVLPRRTAIVPLEQFDLPEALSGAFGTNRGKQSKLNARTDLEAIDAWLRHRQMGSNTLRAYRKEAERFLLWSVLEAGKALSSLTVSDCIAYRDFLSRLGQESDERWRERFSVPQSDWIGQRGIDRFSLRWRPFEGSLSATSQRTALIILQGMMQWFCDASYLYNNPFKTMPRLARPKSCSAAPRSLNAADWDEVEGHLASMKKDHAYFRLRFILALACTTGCSVSTLASMKRSDLYVACCDEKQEGQWELVVAGKGAIQRRINLDHAFILKMNDYFQQRGYQSFIEAPAETPLIASYPAPFVLEPKASTSAEKNAISVGESPLSPARIYKIFKSFFGEMAAATEIVSPTKAARYKAVSPHWLKPTVAPKRSQNRQIFPGE